MRGTEIMANIVSIYGEGPMGAKLLNRFTPELFDAARKAIDMPSG